MDISNDDYALSRIKEAAEKIKIELCSGVKSEVNLPFLAIHDTGPKHLICDLSRS